MTKNNEKSVKKEESIKKDIAPPIDGVKKKGDEINPPIDGKSSSVRSEVFLIENVE